MELLPGCRFIKYIKWFTMEMGEIGIEESSHPAWINSHFTIGELAKSWLSNRVLSTNLMTGVRGEKTEEPVLIGEIWASLANTFAVESLSSESLEGISAMSSFRLFKADGDGASLFFSRSFASSPSTRFNKASRTSVLGPRFFGTASTQVSHCQEDAGLTFWIDQEWKPALREICSELTIDTRTLEDLASFTRWAKSIAFDLMPPVRDRQTQEYPRSDDVTLRFRHDLQFMDSRGSLLIRWVGSRSIPICGLAMAMG